MTTMAARSQRSEARGQRSDRKASSTSSSTKATASGTFANPAPAMPAASPVITALMTDSLENDDADNKIDPTNGNPATTERIIYSTTITNTVVVRFLDAVLRDGKPIPSATSLTVGLRAAR